MEEHNQNSVCEQLLSSKYPLLVGQNPEATKDDDHIIYTMHKPLSYFKCKIPELHGRRIRGCFHGWVVLSNHPYNVLWSLWNPVTSKLIHLPTLNRILGDFHECCLSSPPDDPRSVFLLITDEKPTIIWCQLHRKSKKLRWNERSYAKQFRAMLNGEYGFLENPTCCNGKVYALTRAYHPRVVEVDIVVKNDKVLIILLAFVDQPEWFLNRCPFYTLFSANFYLKGSGTDLFYIEINFDDETRKTVASVYLFKLDMISMKWEEIQDLKDAVFFIELASHEDQLFYRPGITSELGGYIHILDEMGKVIYSYNVKSRTISLSSIPNFVLKSEVPVWAMLECRLEGDPSDSKQHEEKEDPTVIRSVACDLVEIDRSTSESHMLNIPIHILEMIVELCVGVEYMNFRATCKRCSLAAPPLQWINKTSRGLQTYSLVSPWLMVFDKHLGRITFTDPLSGDKYFKKTPHELIGFQIYCSRYGWLLMYKIDGPLVFYNPFTNDIRELPAVGYLQNFCFSAPPTSSDCIVVGLTSRVESHLRVHFVGGEPLWLRLVGDDDPSFFRFPTFCGQDLYVLCNDSGFDVYRKLAHKDYSWDWESVIDEAPRSCTSTARRFLAKCERHLFLVVVGEFGESVEVFKVNESKKEWEKIDCLGNHMIYICATTCLCIEAKLPEMENKIYFPRLHSANGKIVFYSLETCKYHTFNGKALGESFLDFFGPEYQSNPHTWIEPSWS